LLEKTKIPEEDFKRHLQSLYVHPKCKILAKVSTVTSNIGNPNDQDSQAAMSMSLDGGAGAAGVE